MKKRYNIYFIGYLPEDVQNEILTTDEIHNDLSSFSNVDLNILKSIKLQYALDIPTSSGMFPHSNLIGSKDVLKYNTLSELLNDFIFEFDYDDASEEEFENDESDSEDEEIEFNADDRVDHFFEGGNFVIVKQNIKSKKYSIVDRDTIFNCYDQLMDKLEGELNFEESETFDKSKYVVDFDQKEINMMIDKFQVQLEKLIEQDSCQVSISANGDDYYLFSIIKKDSKLEKEIIETGEILEEANSRGFIFDGTYKEYVGYILHKLKQGIPLGCAITTVITDYDIKDESKIFTKCYGYVIGFKENQVVINQLPAKEVAKGYTFNADSGLKLESRRNIIYCGFKKDDIVCGFDLDK